MTPTALDTFIAQAAARIRLQPEPADCVLALAPLMLDLIGQAGSFLQAQHNRSSATGYARNLMRLKVDSLAKWMSSSASMGTMRAGGTSAKRGSLATFYRGDNYSDAGGTALSDSPVNPMISTDERPDPGGKT